jgi:DNA-binding beta-propeller fold protein YncE
MSFCQQSGVLMVIANRLAVAGYLWAASIWAMPAVAQPSPECNAPASQAVLKAHLPGHPFEALASHDGCWVFVSLRLARDRGGIAVLNRMAGTLTQTRIALLSGPLPAGMALTHDGALLIVPDGSHVYFLDTDRLIHGADPVIGMISDGGLAGAINAATTSDDQLLFVSDESLHQVTVIDLAKARQSVFKQRAIIGQIPTGREPVGLALSSHDDYLFITSEVLPQHHSSPTCRSQGQKGGAYVPEGVLEVVSIAGLQPNPAKAIVGAVTAGCSPVRAVLSAQGDRLYVTARASDALLIFDPAALVSDPAHALLAKVPVGNAPVGLAVVDQGRRIVVANSGRFGGAGGQDLTVIDASRVNQGGDAVDGTVAVGHFPRELHATDDGKVLLVTDFDSDQIELLSVDQLPETRTLTQ